MQTLLKNGLVLPVLLGSSLFAKSAHAVNWGNISIVGPPRPPIQLPACNIAPERVTGLTPDSNPVLDPAQQAIYESQFNMNPKQWAPFGRGVCDDASAYLMTIDAIDYLHQNMFTTKDTPSSTLRNSYVYVANALGPSRDGLVPSGDPGVDHPAFGSQNGIYLGNSFYYYNPLDRSIMLYHEATHTRAPDGKPHTGTKCIFAKDIECDLDWNYSGAFGNEVKYAAAIFGFDTLATDADVYDAKDVVQYRVDHDFDVPPTPKDVCGDYGMYPCALCDNGYFDKGLNRCVSFSPVFKIDVDSPKILAETCHKVTISVGSNSPLRDLDYPIYTISLDAFPHHWNLELYSDAKCTEANNENSSLDRTTQNWAVQRGTPIQLYYKDHAAETFHFEAAAAMKWDASSGSNPVVARVNSVDITVSKINIINVPHIPVIPFKGVR